MALAGCVWKSDYDALQAQNNQLQQQLSAQQTQVGRLQGAIIYTVESDLLFAPGSWTIKPRGRDIMADFAHKLGPTQQSKLTVTGYTDNTPVGPGLRRQGVTSNQELSEKRAQAVVDFLVSQGVRPEMLSAQGAGDANPIASNSTPEGRAKNRRVEFSTSPT
jgi:chemotaxis protein MotB